MERHAALPDRDDIEWIRDVICERMAALVDRREHVGDEEKETTADDDAEHRVHDEFLRLLDSKTGSRATALALQLEVHQDGAHNVREPIPVDAEPFVDVDGDRVDVRIAEPVAGIEKQGEQSSTS